MDCRSDVKMDNRVFLSQCDTYQQAETAVARVFDAFGGAGAVLAGRRRVLVKPNLLMPRKPDSAVTTHPAVVQAVCSQFVNAGAEVSIIDSTGGPHTKIILKALYGRCAMDDAAQKSGAKLSYDTSSRVVTFPDGRVIDKLDLLAPALDAELVVSVAKAKTHSFQSMTGCVKNMFGCVTGLGKPAMHRRFPKREDFAGMLVDVCRRINPGFGILDGVWGMEGAGPSGGDPKQLRFIAGGFSPYAVDLAQCYLMGLRQDSVYTISEAVARGLSPEIPGELEWLGDDREGLRASCMPAVTHKEDAVPSMTDDCIGCGDCERICPMKCIKIVKDGGSIKNDGNKKDSGKTKNGKAAVDAEKCIRCYCCHEFCPVKAVRL